MYYAQIDEKGYCIAISDLGENMTDETLIMIPEMNENYLKRKYDKEKKCWTKQWKQSNTVIQSQQTDMQMMMQAMTELELLAYEEKAQRQVLSQKTEELEKSIKEMKNNNV